MHRGFRKFATLLAAAMAAVPAVAANDHAGLSGVVRDANGTPQMGVMVELLCGGIVATAFTDVHGRYHIDQLRPGIYDVETSAALFLPTLKRRLHLDAGVRPIVDLTLSGLLDDSGWTKARVPGRNGDLEDWKWTLRSPANRPMLRLVDDDSHGGARGGELRQPGTGGRRASLMASYDAGSYGASGEQVRVETGRQSSDASRDQNVRIRAGSAVGSSDAIPFAVSAGSVTGRGSGIQRRVSAAIRSFPQIETGGQSGLTVLELESAQMMEIGSAGALEIGGSATAMHSGGTLVALRPYAQLSVRPAGAWLIHYRYATSPGGLAGAGAFGDRDGAPTLVRGANGELRTASGNHHELGISRPFGRTKMKLAAFHDGRQTVVRDVQFLPAAAQGNVDARPGMALDSVSGISHALSAPFSGTGAQAGIEVPLGVTGSMTALYVNSVGLAQSVRSSGALSRRASALCLIVQRSIPRSSTGVSVSYRWQAPSIGTIVGPYSEPGTAPYLGVHVVQRLPSLGAGSVKTLLTVDGANLLAEGYREAPDSMGDAVMMSTVREIRAGLAVTF